MTHEPMLEGITDEMVEAGETAARQMLGLEHRTHVTVRKAVSAIYTAMEAARRPDPEAGLSRLIEVAELAVAIAADGTIGDGLDELSMKAKAARTALNPSPALVSEGRK